MKKILAIVFATMVIVACDKKDNKVNDGDGADTVTVVIPNGDEETATGDTTTVKNDDKITDGDGLIKNGDGEAKDGTDDTDNLAGDSTYVGENPSL